VNAPVDASVVRVLGAADAAAWRALRLRGLREHPEAFTSSHEEDAAHPPEVAAARLASPRVTFWGAFLHGTLAGIVGLERETRAKNRHKATVVGLFVAPEAAGHGLGHALLQALLAQARAEGLQLLVLTVTEGNDTAVRLYRRCGFRAFGTEPRAILVDGRAYGKIHMYLALTSAS